MKKKKQTTHTRSGIRVKQLLKIARGEITVMPKGKQVKDLRNFVAISGNIVSGFKFIGPFQTHKEMSKFFNEYEKLFQWSDFEWITLATPEEVLYG